MGNPLAGVDSDVWLSASPSLNTTNESCTDSGDHINYIASVHFFWDDNQPLVVQNSPNGSSSWVTVTDYVFRYATGQIIFNTARVPATNNFTRISTGYYFNVTQLDASSKWGLSIKGNVVNTTPFQATGAWAQYTPTIKGATGTIDTFRNDPRVWNELIATNNQVILQLFVSKTNNWRWQFAANITQVDQSADAQGIQAQKIGFSTKKEVILLTT
jgi:hypothetical protein